VLDLYSLRMERARLSQRSGDLVFQSGRRLRFVIANGVPAAIGAARRLLPMNHEFASNVPKSVKSLDCRTQLVRAEG